MELKKEIEASNANMHIFGILMTCKAMGLDETRERSIVREMKGAEAKPWTLSVRRRGREGGAGKGG